MAITIVATSGAANANSFITLAEAETYMESRGNKDTWDAASDADKNITLAEATREISIMCFIGLRASTTQSLSWPRELAVDPDDPDGNYFDVTEIPVRVKNATAELSFQYIKAGTTDVGAITALTNVKKKVVDVLSTEYFSPSGTPVGVARFPGVINQLQALLENAGLTISLIKG